jgi:ankyrin repeat protein
MKSIREIYYNNIGNPQIAELIKEGIINNFDLSLFNYNNLVGNISSKDFIDIYLLLKNKGFIIDKTIIFSLISHGQNEVISALKLTNYINFLDEYGKNALFYLIRQFYEKDIFIKRLNNAVELGVKYDLEDNNGENLLHQFFKDGKPDYYLDEILKLKLNINKANKQGWTPLHLACLGRDGFTEVICGQNDYIIEALVNNGADLSLKTDTDYDEENGDIITTTENQNAFELKMTLLNSIGGELSKGTEAYNTVKEYYKKLLMPN